ncbi:MAG: hydrogenase maturation protease [bacterium]|nr:hydrogenase maturation protease [bacterium]
MIKTLVLGLGNEMISDDAIGILAVRQARRLWEARHLNSEIEFVECSVHGIALLEFFMGYDRAILVDSIQTGKHPPGTILVVDPNKLAPVTAPSPHFTGLPELLGIAHQLKLPFPKEFSILAMEVSNTNTLGEKLSPAVEFAMPLFVDKIIASI